MGGEKGQSEKPFFSRAVARLRDHVKHEVNLSARHDDGKSHRSHIESQAKKGDKNAREFLRGPTYPIAVEYLHRWLYELYGRSGATMDGVAPLAWSTVTHWAKWTGRRPEAWEIEVLVDLDGILRAGPTKKPKASG